MAARLSARLGAIEWSVVARIRDLLARSGLPVEPPSLSVAAWRGWLASDKKVDAGRLRFVLLDALGSAHVASVDDAVLDDVLRGDVLPAAVSG
jgi:3-dehydroquinate synthase